MMKLSDQVRPDVEAAPWVIEKIINLENENDILWKKVAWAWKQIFEIPVLTSTDSLLDDQSMMSILRTMYANVANENESLKARLRLLEHEPPMTASQVRELMIKHNIPLSPSQIKEIP